MISLGRRQYNEERLHSSLEYRTPDEFTRERDRSGRLTANLRDYDPAD